MNELLSVTYDNDRITVSARELHKQLGIEKRFGAWFETNSKGFMCGIDFNPYLQVQVQIEGSREVKREKQDYQLTLDMAKHLCLMSRTEKGKKARQYLIDLEKDWNSPDKVMARALIMANNRLEEQNLQIQRMRPKEIFADAVSASKSSILVGDLAKILHQNGIKIGQKRLFVWLRSNGYLIKQQGASWNMPTQKSMELGLFEIKETTITHSDGHITTSKTVKVTGKGQVYFITKFLKE